MSLPAVTRSWTISPNNRIPFVSVLDVVRNYLHGIKTFLVSNGYVVKGSCDGATGGMDGVDRWVAPTHAGTRAAAAAAPQSWIVLIDGNGIDILISHQGSRDGIARLSFSPGGLFQLAGPAAGQPTASDEQIISTGDTVGTEPSADRLWSGWVSNDKKACRFMVARSGHLVDASAALWGVESVSSTVTNAVFAPDVWGFALPGAIAVLGPGGIIQTGTPVGVARVSVSSVPFSCQAKFGMETHAGSTATWNATKPELQGGVGYPMYPLAIGSTTAGASGKIGNLVDWWTGRVGNSDGDAYGNNQFISIAGPGQLVWPWDGETTPVLT